MVPAILGVLLISSSSARAYVIPAFSIPPAAPQPLQPTTIQASTLNLKVTLLSAEKALVESDLYLLSPTTTAVKTAIPAQGVADLMVAVDGQPVEGLLFPLTCQGQASPAADCVYQFQINGATDAIIHVATRYTLAAESARAVSSLYSSTTLDDPPAPDPKSVPRQVQRNAKAFGTSLRGLTRWASPPKEVCITMSGTNLLEWLRDLSPHGWLVAGPETINWQWDGSLAPLPQMDLMAQLVTGVNRADEDTYYQNLGVKKDRNLDRWLHLASIRRFGKNPTSYQQALDQAFTLASKYFFNIPAQNDSRVYIIPELVALSRAQGGHGVAQTTAKNYKKYLATIMDALLLDGKDTQYVAQALAMVDQLAIKSRRAVCPPLSPVLHPADTPAPAPAPVPPPQPK